MLAPEIASAGSARLPRRPTNSGGLEMAQAFLAVSERYLRLGNQFALFTR